MSSSDGKGKDAHLVTIVEDLVRIGLGLAVDRHTMHAAVLAAGQVELIQESGQIRPLRKLERSPAPRLCREQRTKARKEMHMYAYGQAELSSPPARAWNSATIILKNVGRGKKAALRSAARLDTFRREGYNLGPSKRRIEERACKTPSPSNW